MVGKLDNSVNNKQVEHWAVGYINGFYKHKVDKIGIL